MGRFTVARQKPVEQKCDKVYDTSPQPTHLKEEELKEYNEIQRRIAAGESPSIKDIIKVNIANLQMLKDAVAKPEVTKLRPTVIKKNKDGKTEVVASSWSVPPDTKGPGGVLDPNYKLLKPEIVKRFIMRAPSCVLETTLIQILPNVLLLADAFQVVETEFLTSLLFESTVEWSQTPGNPPQVRLDEEFIEDRPGLKRMISRLVRLCNIQQKKFEIQAELISGFQQYEKDFSSGHYEKTILLFLKSKLLLLI